MLNLITGIITIYSTIHFFILQKKSYENRSRYEKVVTWFAMVLISLVFVGIMAGN